MSPSLTAATRDLKLMPTLVQELAVNSEEYLARDLRVIITDSCKIARKSVAMKG